MAAPSRIAAALDYLERLKSQADQANAQTQLQTAKVARDFAGGVGQNLANRARDLGQMGYEAFTSAPATPQTTAEFAELASQRQPTPMLDATVQGLGQVGKALVTDPVGTGKAIIGGEIDRARSAASSPAAAGEYAGGFIDPMRIAKALRRAAPVLELDVYHGTPHRFPATEANPLGEFDASKIGTGEGAQAYGHGVYLAENPDVAKGYKSSLSADRGFSFEGKTGLTRTEVQDLVNAKYGKGYLDNILRPSGVADSFIDDMVTGLNRPEGTYPKQYKPGSERAKVYDELRGKITHANPGSLYKADLPDEMIDKMLDWDKPLSEQRELATPILKELGYLRPNDNGPRQFAAAVKSLSLEHGGFGQNGATGMALFKSIHKSLEQGKPQAIDFAKRMNLGEEAMFMDAPALASAVMRKMGIPGIKYLDAGSRGATGTGTRNFVVFPGEEKKVKILERK